MTTTRVVEWKNDEIDGQVEVSIEEKDKSKPIYYTSDEPKFEINVKNSTDFDITNKTCIDWVIAIGQGRPKPLDKYRESDIEIPAGDSYAFEISGKQLSLEGHGIIGTGRGSFHEIDHDNKTFRLAAMRVNQEQYEPLATFSVWDKEHYEIIHEIPLRAQILTVFLSLAIVIFGAIQSAAILGIQIGIVLGLVGLSLLYVVYTIDSSDLINK